MVNEPAGDERHHERQPEQIADGEARRLGNLQISRNGQDFGFGEGFNSLPITASKLAIKEDQKD